MKKLPAYEFKSREVVVYPEIWDSKKQLLKPLKSMDGHDLSEVLDSVTLATEAGVLSLHDWPQQVFANRGAFDEFLEALRDYDDCFRITDRWWTALAQLADTGDEEGFISGHEIAEVLLEAASEDGRLGNFGRKSPKYRFSAEECKAAILLQLQDAAAGYVLDGAERVAMQEKTGFGLRHYDIQVSDAEVSAARTAGLAAAKAAKKTSARKTAKA